jgi:hypothetical protein
MLMIEEDWLPAKIHFMSTVVGHTLSGHKYVKKLSKNYKFHK